MGAYTTKGKLWKPAAGDTGWSSAVNGNVDRQSEVQINVKAHGAVADGVADDTTAIQAAINEADAQVSSSTNVPTVYFPAGKYSIHSNIDWKSCNLAADGPNSGVRLLWDGTAGGTMITKNASATGAMSFCIMENICLGQGSTVPATLIDFSALNVDVLGQLRRVHLRGCSGDAIKVANWTNLHWEHLRWDSCGGYGIMLTPGGSLNLSTLSISHFTYANVGSDPNPGKGVIGVDSSGGAANVGTILLHDGRIEVNTAWTSHQAIVNWKGEQTRASAIHISDVTFQAAAGSPVVLYIESVSTSLTGRLILQNFDQTGLNAVHGGNWSASRKKLPLVSWYPYAVVGANNHGAELDWPLILDGLSLDYTASATGPVGSVVKKLQVFDASGSSLGYIPIYNSIT